MEKNHETMFLLNPRACAVHNKLNVEISANNAQVDATTLGTHDQFDMFFKHFGDYVHSALQFQGQGLTVIMISLAGCGGSPQARRALTSFVKFKFQLPVSS
jgi:hypothetical protein